VTIKLGVIMDPINNIKTHKDSTFAMLLAAQQRGWTISYMEQNDLYLSNGETHAHMRDLQVDDNTTQWFNFGNSSEQALHALDVVLMRKDPPFDMEYIYTTYLLELAQSKGLLVVNDPRSLRDANEKLFTAWFPQCCPPTLVSRDAKRLLSFLDQYHDVIIKPLAGMGGQSIFRIRQNDANKHVIIETLTDQETRYALIQRYIPEIKKYGDKRILLIDGQPISFALARMPANDETRANLATGGHGVAVEITDKDRWICEQVAPVLKEKGLLFVGLDVIGDYLTEINVTSPTCIREIDAQCNTHISDIFLNCINNKLCSHTQV